ncbi:MAG: hypothetical protein WCT19_03905 [Candidatus Paceibacterota bacterium]
MKTKRRIVHVICDASLKWDLTERKWVIWPRFIASCSRYYHSARLERKDFEMFCGELPCFRQARWLTYKNNKLVRVRSVGYVAPYPIQETLEGVDHNCLNSAGVWWKPLCGR